MRHWCVLLILLVSLGCKQSTASFDPFSTYGPTLIPPPPTGTAGKVDPYYQRAAAPTNPNSLSVFTSDQQNGVAVADQRGASASSNSGAPVNSGGANPNLQWQSPVSDDPLQPGNPSPQVTPAIPTDRRIGRSTAPTGSGATPIASSNPAGQVLQPSPPALTFGTQATPPATPPAPTYTPPPSYNAPAGYQQPVQQQPPQGAWQNRY
ncbi:MAG: hypothetical protein GY768_16015 [Planctomycetaceae bacterium]|nr:hypothetical protein [Planctomycetaceae bacterium]